MIEFLQRRIKAWLAYRVTAHILDGLDDWLLADIGTERDQIADFAAAHASGREIHIAEKQTPSIACFEDCIAG